MLRKNPAVWSLLGIVVAVICLYFLPSWWLFWCLTLLICTSFLFLRFTIVEEGTAKAVMILGKFSKIIFQWEDHWIDTDWSIWKKQKEGEEREKGSENKIEKRVWGRILGGSWIYFWPFQKIHQYKHRWTDIRLKDSRMEVEFHEEDGFGHVLLKPAVYAFKLTAVETKPPERIPVDVLFLVTLRITNPYSFCFIAPPTPIEDILARVSAEARALVTACLIDDLLQLKGASLWKLLTEAKVIEDTLQKWGVQLAEKGIEIKEINLPPDYQKAAASGQEQRLRAKGTATQTIGAMVAMIAEATGQDVEVIQGEFQNPEAAFKKYEKLIQVNLDFIQRHMAIDGDAFIDIRTQNPFLDLLALWKKIPDGKGMPGSNKSSAGSESDKIKGKKENANSPENDPKGPLPEHLKKELAKWEDKHKKP
ncbi:hypothetical protein KKE19_00885 [Patescibacteria group bacterium]|nr:hypothetical protein [Patescibacteria group bacterium]MBU4367543.1 hypothetical protein [Patescibacteria group bacterium]MBU4461584.1 hypothetical protein [Patescibacteria group bacterium]MCG2699481.1 hypothetical protein [Candidatus Parcubacteria bacterium]